MSNIVSGIAQKRSVGSSPRKAVLMLMAACASDDGKGIWVSKSNMAADLEMSRRTVQKAVTELVEMGVVFEAGKRPCKNGYTVEYGIDIDALSALKCTRAADAPVQQVRMTCAAGAHQDVQQVRMNSPLTINEPSFGGDPPAKPKKRAVAIPPDWVPSERNIADAEARQFSAKETDHEADQFRDYHLARGSTFKDWDAAWRTWLGNARKFSRGRGVAGTSGGEGHGRGGSIASIVARRRAENPV